MCGTRFMTPGAAETLRGKIGTFRTEQGVYPTNHRRETPSQPAVFSTFDYQPLFASGRSLPY
jgi:hypothetical protein